MFLVQDPGHLQSIPFAVDAALLRELGERLIGQPQIALAELVKNAYDADASTCRIVFKNDSIEIIDDGHGMTPDEFKQFWMRIGSTHKVDAPRSRKLGRPVTGSKGVGRLAVQFLARKMEIESTSDGPDSNALIAKADWDEIKSGQDLNVVKIQLDDSPEIPFDDYPNGNKSGTIIRLSGLREQWTKKNIEGLGQAIWVLRSPFRQRDPMPTISSPENFDVEIDAPDIENAKAELDEMLDALFSNWKARIRGQLEQGRRNGEALISVEFKQGYPSNQPREVFQEWVKIPVRPSEESGTVPLFERVDFEILVFKLERRQTGGILLSELREYLEKFGNVSIYDAGFRLPYYGAEQDWLGISADHARRLSASELLPSKLKIDQRYMLDLPESRRIMGFVDINTNAERRLIETSSATPGDVLQLSPGRDRLHNNRAHKQLSDLVRYSLDYYANRYAVRNARGIDSQRDTEPASAKQERALEILSRNADAIPVAVYKEVRREVEDALNVSRNEEEKLDRRAALLAPLASAGMVALALNHELSRERVLLDRSVLALRRTVQEQDLPQIDSIIRDFESASARFEAIQELFAPLLTQSDVVANDRLRVEPVVRQVVGALSQLMGGLRFDFTQIPSELRFPIGSLAEWSSLLQNVVTNAWNATLESSDPLISFEGGASGNREWLRISDNGKGLGVPFDEAKGLFDPFVRKTALRSDLESIAIGGQGLGLTIVRMIAARRGARVAFIEPREEFATTFELSWKG